MNHLVARVLRTTETASSFAPQHPQSIYGDFVDARFHHQRLRATQELSVAQSAQMLSDALSPLVTAIKAPEGHLARESGKTPGLANLREHYVRFPELRDLEVLSGSLEDRSVEGAGVDYSL